MSDLKWSKYQQAIFDEVENGKGHLVIQARAGAAKTTSLVQSLHHVSPFDSWLLCAFNKRIAAELKRRAPNTGEIRTNHSLGLKAIKNHFPKAEVNNDKVWEILNRLVGKDRKWNNVKVQLKKAVSLCKACLIDDPQSIDILLDEYDIDTMDMDRGEFIDTISKALLKSFEDTNNVDFDDMIWFPNVYDMKVGNYDRIFIDEAQDLSKGQLELALKAASDTGRITAVGDNFQCVDESTLLQTPDGLKKIIELSLGDKILSYRKGQNEFQTISNLKKSSWASGFEIETESGKKLLMSPNHKIWARLPKLKDGQKIVYIMYRKDLGYRVGKTNKLRSETNPFGHRLGSESGDKIWIIDIVDSEPEALFKEKSYSLRYGIPTEVFNGKNRGLDQERINKIFSIFGDNGIKLLSDKNLFFDYPHWTSPSQTSERYSTKRRVVRLTTHHPKANKIHFEWEDKHLLNTLESKNYSIQKGTNKNKTNYRIRKEIASYKEAYLFAKKLANDADAYISERMSFNRKPVNLITASGLFVGSSVFVRHENSIRLEKIVSIKEKSGVFYDIEVNDAGNFFGNEVLSHNSIYSWAGAGTDNLDKLAKRLNAKVLPLPITYRCPLKVVKHAQQFVPDIQPRPNAPEGTLEYISSKDMMKKAKPGCFILSRINAPLIGLALKFIGNGVPCNIQGRDIGANLVTIIKKSRRKTIPAFLSWLEKWEHKEVARVTKMNRSPVPIRDKAQCLRTLADACSSVGEMKIKIQDLFEDGDDTSRIILSTVHRAKGLERDIVFVLSGTFFGGNKEERNIAYVACTRSAAELYFVTGGNYGLKKGKRKKNATKSK